MNKLLPLLYTFFSTLAFYPACCQDKIPDFGKIDIADLKLIECPFEKGADAMYLLKTENVTSGFMKGTGDMAYVGLAKAETLESEEKDDKGKENSNSLAGNDGGELKIDSSSIQHDNDDNDTLTNKIAFHYTMSNTGDIYFLNPFMFSMFKKNPFKDSTRFSDIDFGSNQLYLTKILVAVPDNFSVEEIPKSILIRMADSAVMFKREIFSANKQVLIRNSFTVNRTLFDKEEYSSLKSFFDKVYALINEQIVLKKNE